MIAQLNDVYCEESLSPEFAHVWVQVFEAASVTVAMFCLIQFYIQLKTDLAEHRPFLKVLCIKLVIFFSFWQSVSSRIYTVWERTANERKIDCNIVCLVVTWTSATNEDAGLPRYQDRYPKYTFVH